QSQQRNANHVNGEDDHHLDDRCNHEHSTSARRQLRVGGLKKRVKSNHRAPPEPAPRPSAWMGPVDAASPSTGKPRSLSFSYESPENAECDFAMLANTSDG